MIVYPSIAGRLKNQHEAIDLVISSIHPERLHFRNEEGKWSIHDNIAHLTCYQPVFTERVRCILKEETPSFSIYVPDQDEAFEMYRTIDTYTLLQQLGYERKLLYQLISKLDTTALDRTGIHPRFGELTILKWTEFFLLHEAHHIFAMFRLANEKKAGD